MACGSITFHSTIFSDCRRGGWHTLYMLLRADQQPNYASFEYSHIFICRWKWIWHTVDVPRFSHTLTVKHYSVEQNINLCILMYV